MRRTPQQARRGALITAAAVACAALVLLGGCRPEATTVAPPTPTPPASPEERIGELRATITALDFLNRLQLEPDQIAQLVPLLETAGQARERAEAREQELLADLAPLLEQQVDYLRRDEPVPSTLEAQVRGVEDELRNLPLMDPQVKASTAEGLRAILSPEQVAVVMGVLEAHIQAADMLDGFRALRPDEFEAQIGLFAQELARPDTGMTPEQVEALLREARTLSADEYQHSKGTLVGTLEPLFAPGQEAADQLLVRAFTRPNVLAVLTDKSWSADR